jgi:hypothetical protein
MTKLTHAIPTAALWLGVAGIIPFIGLAVQVATGWPRGGREIGPALYALTIYGAVILSFMGGVQWGIAVADTHLATGWRRYGIAVVPALIAWAGVWIGQRDGLLILTTAFAALLVYDLWTVNLGEAPSWYGHLRIGLSAMVCAALLAAAQLGPF